MKRVLPIVMTTTVLLAWMTWPHSGLTHVTTTNTVIFDREIVDILNAHCVACHAEASLAPPLETYEETWLRRSAVLAAVLDHGMPPWAAVPGYGEFSNDNGLTLRETHFLTSWVEGLGPRNDGAVFLNVRDAGDGPAVIQANPDFDTWVLGEPDLSVRLGETVVEAGQGERIERRIVDLGLTKERWVRGLEFKPGDRRVVRFASFRIEDTGQWLGTWTPWHGFVELPEGVAYHMPAGTRIAAEIYYGTSDAPVTDDGVLGLFFDSGTTPVQPSNIVLETRGAVAPGPATTRFVAATQMGTDAQILALWPEFEAGIESLEVSVRTPDGGTRVLLFAKDIPIEWPTPYILTEPVSIEAGSELRVTAYYSNASGDAQPGGVRLTLGVHQD